jgi:hypothetical protein
LNNGVAIDSQCYRITWQYSENYTKCVEMTFVGYSNSEKIFSIDSFQFRAPIVELGESYMFYLPDLVADHYYRFLPSINTLYNKKTKSETESNDSILVIIEESNFNHGDGVIRSGKTYTHFFSNGYITESTTVKDSNGNWENSELSSLVLGPDSTDTITTKHFYNGSWTLGYILITNQKGYNFLNGWDSTIQHCMYEGFLSYDSHRKECLFGNNNWNIITNSWDTVSQIRRINNYDLNGNLITRVSLQKDSTDPWIKIDSTVYTYAQINIASSQIASQKPTNPISFSQTSRMLNVLAPGITGVRIYDIAGRLAVSVNQPAAPTFSLDLSKAGTSRMTAGRYLVQVETNKGRHTIPLLIMR